jgi:hypothetical protein
MTSERTVNRPTRAWRLVVLAYLGWIVPAILGTIFNWPWWIVLLLLTPTCLWYILTEGALYYAESRKVSPTSPLIYRIPLLRVVPVLLPLSLIQGRFAGLILAFALVALDAVPMRRISWYADEKPSTHPSA